MNETPRYANASAKTRLNCCRHAVLECMMWERSPANPAVTVEQVRSRAQTMYPGFQPTSDEILAAFRMPSHFVMHVVSSNEIFIFNSMKAETGPWTYYDGTLTHTPGDYQPNLCRTRLCERIETAIEAAQSTNEPVLIGWDINELTDPA